MSLEDNWYKKGELEVGDEGEYEPDPDHPTTTDWMGEVHYGKSRLVRIVKVARLPHRCDEWTIGGPEQIRWLINDLGEALKEVS